MVLEVGWRIIVPHLYPSFRIEMVNTLPWAEVILLDFLSYIYAAIYLSFRGCLGGELNLALIFFFLISYNLSAMLSICIQHY